MHDPVRTVHRQVWRDSGVSEGSRTIPEETALALTYNGGTYAVMMGTPQNLRDFAVGFSLSEGIVQSADDIRSLDIVHLDDGIELRMWLEPSQADRLSERRRHIAGPTGCGICGIDSIAEAVRPAAIVAARPVVFSATDHGGDAGHRRRCRRSISKPARCTPRRSGRRAAASSRLREDVGRHNALDKLAGALAQGKIAASEGMVLLTSRVSVEMVQKTAAMGAPLMVAVSAPTALAVRMADAAGITLAAIARADGFEIFTHPEAHRRRRRRRKEPSMSPDRLIYMANQIGKFFESQGHDKAVPGIAEHIRKFWDPRMRTKILAHLDAGGAGLDPDVREALATLRVGSQRLATRPDLPAPGHRVRGLPRRPPGLDGWIFRPYGA